MDTNGTVTAIKAGNAVITASIDEGRVKATCKVTVTSGTAVESILLSEHSVTKNMGDLFTLSYTITPDTASIKDVIWSSSNKNVVMASSDGKLLALKAGTSNVTVKTVDGSYSDTVKITVQDKAGYKLFTLPAELDMIEESAFEGNIFTHITLDSKLRVVREKAFSNCSDMIYVFIPDSVVYIADNAFSNSPKVILGCRKNSYALRYAKENGIRYFILE